MYKRHYFALLGALAVCFGLLVGLFFAESRKLDSSYYKKRYNIEVVLKARNNPPDFWRVVEQGISVAAGEFDVSCNVTAPDMERDVAMQIGLVEEAINRRPDAIILAACDYERLSEVSRKAVSAGIVLITLDSDVNLEQRRCFVGTDNYEIGKKLALLTDEVTNGSGRIGVIGHVETTTTAIERLGGLLYGLRGSEIEITGIEYCGGSEEYARVLTERLISENPDITCMVGLNESSSLGIAYAIENLEKRDSIQLVACDSSEKQIKFMEDGLIRGFVIQNPFNMGYLGVKNAVSLLNGETVPPVINTDSVIIREDDLYKAENQKLLFPFTDEG